MGKTIPNKVFVEKTGEVKTQYFDAMEDTKIRASVQCNVLIDGAGYFSCGSVVQRFKLEETNGKKEMQFLDIPDFSAVFLRKIAIENICQ